jgi:hypothetical protein
MTIRNFGAPLSAMLISAFLTVAVSASAATTSVAITNFRAAWFSTATCEPGAVVTVDGTSYICLVKNTNVQPNTNTGDWSIMDAQGATGATGPAGSTGAAGATGAQGPQGMTGPPGEQWVRQGHTAPRERKGLPGLRDQRARRDRRAFKERRGLRARRERAGFWS